MDSLAPLISKLNEQFEQNADATQLLVTTQQLEAALMQMIAAQRRAAVSSKVSVVMPAERRVHTIIPEPVVVPAPAVNQPVSQEVVPQPVQTAQPEAEVTAPVQKPIHFNEETVLPAVNEVVKNGNHTTIEKPAQKASSNGNGWHFDPLKEIPTLAHQQSVKELNDAIAINKGQASLNDKLKTEVVEVGHRLNDSPVRDLRRAIGINDRYLFINELFRGDEVMYERSIKTINSFRIFPEAEYWIERELKVKLGWDEGKHATHQFYQMVKRRFS